MRFTVCTVLLFLLFLLFLTFNGFSQQGYGSERSEEDTLSKTTIETILKQYYQDFSNRDWHAFATHFWEGAVLTTVWQKPGDSVENIHYITIPEFIEKAPEGPDSQPIFEEKMEHSEIKVENNLAQAWVYYKANFGTEENLYRWEGIDAITLIKFNNHWKITSIAYMSKE